MPVISMFTHYCYDVLFRSRSTSSSTHSCKILRIQLCDKFIDGSVIQGNLPSGKMKLVIAWIELHNEELNANWELAINGNQLFTIKPLQ
jgi:hypothetical protein